MKLFKKLIIYIKNFNIKRIDFNLKNFEMNDTIISNHETNKNIIISYNEINKDKIISNSDMNKDSKKNIISSKPGIFIIYFRDIYKLSISSYIELFFN